MTTSSFTPVANFTMTMTGASVNQALGATGAAVQGLYLYNGGTVPVAVVWGIGAQTATAAAFTIAPGGYFVVCKGLADNVAAIGASGTLYVSAGEGQ